MHLRYHLKKAFFSQMFLEAGAKMLKNQRITLCKIEGFARIGFL